MRGCNTLIIMNDEHAREGVSAYGGVAATPNIDRIAASGTRFDNAYTPSPICVPARAAFQTGQYVSQNRCWSNAQPYHGDPPGWGHRLQDEGLETVSVGKLHYRSQDDNNGFLREIAPLHVLNGEGWVFGLLRREDHTPYDTTSFANHIGAGEDGYTEYDRKVRDAAVAWLGSPEAIKSDKPWTLFVSFLRPHYPLTCPKKWFEKYDPARLPRPRFNGHRTEFRHPVLNAFRSYYNYGDHFDEADVQIARASYFGLCSFVDALIGDVMRALEDNGHNDKTNVLFVADHGELNGHHGLWTKMTMHEESVGIPMLLSGPGVPKGACATPVSLVDVHQTVLASAGVRETAKDAELPGRSLFEIAQQDDDMSRTVYSEYHDGGAITGYAMMRKGKWKYVAYAGFAPQLFDLEADPYEANDLGLLSAYEPVRQELHNQMVAEFGDPDEVSARAFADQADRIAELGGVDGIRARENFDHTPVE